MSNGPAGVLRQAGTQNDAAERRPTRPLLPTSPKVKQTPLWPPHRRVSFAEPPIQETIPTWKEDVAYESRKDSNQDTVVKLIKEPHHESPSFCFTFPLKLFTYKYIIY
ncbi:MAG: hypothetical protein HYT39_03885 [Candidatus Sungbacteria bacterium]|nr:hypothetical protein [Candidatus Sungbacteria bacterium]